MGEADIFGIPRSGDSSGIVTEVRVTPTEFHAGDTVQIAVSACNRAGLPATLQFSSGCLLLFEVRDAAGALVAPKDIVCTANAPTVTLHPGECLDRHFSWSGAEGIGGGKTLPPGEYRVSGVLTAAGKHPASEPVAIKILAP